MPSRATFTILTIFQGTVLWHCGHSHCCVAITAIHLQNPFHPGQLKLCAY